MESVDRMQEQEVRPKERTITDDGSVPKNECMIEIQRKKDLRSLLYERDEQERCFVPFIRTLFEKKKNVAVFRTKENPRVFFDENKARTNKRSYVLKKQDRIHDVFYFFFAIDA